MEVSLVPRPFFATFSRVAKNGLGTRLMLQLELEAESVKFLSERLDCNQKKSFEVEQQTHKQKCVQLAQPILGTVLCTHEVKMQDVKSERLKSRGCRLADHSSSQVSKQQGQSCLHSRPHQL